MNIKKILRGGSLDESVLDRYFKDMTKPLRTCIEALPKTKISEVNKTNGNFQGIYILWREEKPLYVGRAQKQRIYKRLANHRSANAHASSFALRLIREKIASKYKNPAYLVASYGGNEGTTTKEVEEHLNKKINDKVKDEINSLSCSWIEVDNALHQAHMEILCTVALETAPLNNEEKIDRKNYRYLYYNSFDTS